ncbi:hypothetical protein [Bacillus sp. T33-2]|nr:hypothetical protein [Bacillus sp. T33-2]
MDLNNLGSPNEMKMVLANPKGDNKEITVKQLLPEAFSPEELHV